MLSLYNRALVSSSVHFIWINVVLVYSKKACNMCYSVYLTNNIGFCLSGSWLKISSNRRLNSRRAYSSICNFWLFFKIFIFTERWKSSLSASSNFFALRIMSSKRVKESAMIDKGFSTCHTYWQWAHVTTANNSIAIEKSTFVVRAIHIQPVVDFSLACEKVDIGL